jgi:hypothetical protein
MLVRPSEVRMRLLGPLSSSLARRVEISLQSRIGNFVTHRVLFTDLPSQSGNRTSRICESYARAFLASQFPETRCADSPMTPVLATGILGTHTHLWKSGNPRSGFRDFRGPVSQDLPSPDPRYATPLVNTPRYHCGTHRNLGFR